ncbi:3-deoxy-D-manno-octulosonic-acid transferase domain protein [Neisseria meningitidis 2000063]|nr:3-deoxy-D-manno-octulosonic-acid transferase domain protein [Neisseria meningitidis 2000063]
MFQWLYDVLWLLAPIWIRRYLDKRSGSAPAYRAHRGERFGKKNSLINKMPSERRQNG